MTRRRLLNGIAAGLANSFASRNNDLVGYWGIGKLCRLARENGVSSVSVDLLSMGNSLGINELAPMAQQFSQWLGKQIENSRLPTTWIVTVSVEVNFCCEHNSDIHGFQVARGQPFTCAATILDDLGGKHFAIAGGHCREHNPIVETRSARYRRQSSDVI